MRALLNRWPFRLLRYALIALGLATLVLGGMIAWPTRQPAELASITAGVRLVDRSDLPAGRRFVAREGTTLTYRLYEPRAAAGDRLVVLIHGSAGGSINMHAVGKGLAEAGIAAAAMDMRGHGASGTRGDIAYIGQLEHDLADFVAHLRQTRPTARLSLVGHSAGGGFALRATAGPTGDLFERTVLLAPFLGPFAPSSRPASGGWAAPDIPRIVALTILRRLGIDCCEGLPVIVFALPPEAIKFATTRYSYRLLANFATRDHRADLAAARRPVAIVSGTADELMDSARYGETVDGTGRDVPVTLVPGVDHMGILADPKAIAAIVEALK